MVSTVVYSYSAFMHLCNKLELTYYIGVLLIISSPTYYIRVLLLKKMRSTMKWLFVLLFWPPILWYMQTTHSK